MLRRAFFSSFLVVMIFAGCIGEWESKHSNAKSSSEGVVVHGYDRHGRIENTNNFPVRVKKVWQFRGEETKWIKILNPGQSIPDFVGHRNGYYIFSISGQELGFVLPQANGKP